MSKGCCHSTAYTCKEVHRLDGLVMNTVDEEEIAELVIKQYVLALFHSKNMIRKLVAFGQIKFGTQCRFVAAVQVGIDDAVNTRNVQWAVVSETDPDWEHLDWEPYDETTRLMVHIRVFYGKEEDMQVAKLNIFPRIDGSM